MGKRSKSNKKRSQRRERSKTKSEGIFPDEELQASGESVEEISEAVPSPTPAEEHKARQKRAAKVRREEEVPNAWERIKMFFGEVQIEAKKINWPTTDDTWKSTWVTIIVIIFLSVFMGFASFGMSKISDRLFRLGTNIPESTNAVAPGSVPITPLGAAVDTLPAQPEESGGGAVPLPVPGNE